MTECYYASMRQRDNCDCNYPRLDGLTDMAFYGGSLACVKRNQIFSVLKRETMSIANLIKTNYILMIYAKRA